MTRDQQGTGTAAAADGIDLRDSTGLIPPRGHYSHVAGRAGIASISGQLDHCLHTAGSSRGRLLSVAVHVTDIAQWPAFDAAYARWVGAHRPARAVAGVAGLHHGAALEVMAVATVAPAR